MIPLGLQRDLLLLDVVLPIGISFFTFQGISYVVDVYRKDVEVVKNPLDLFLFISFFPQLVAGPIVRASHFLPQLRQRPSLDSRAVVFGFLLLLIGLFKKMIVASYLASEIVDDVFAFPAAYSSVDLLAGAFGFVVQIYCDFSGYSDIAIGVAALLGYHFKRNFDRPLSATSLQELWQRWHISLTSWLRDYLYRPLKGKKRGQGRIYRNLVLTMLAAGLWHGAAWTFVVWGGLQGILLVLERVVKGKIRRYWKPSAHVRQAAGGAEVVRARPHSAWLPGWNGLAWAVTITLFALTSIFFRSADFATAAEYFRTLGSFTFDVQKFTPFVAVLIVGSIAAQFLPSNFVKENARTIQHVNPVVLGLLVGGGLLAIEMIGPKGVAPFIYFQF